MLCYLIDDDEDDRDFFAMALEELDCDITLRTASNAEQALETLRGGVPAPDIIFLDINMPRIDGWECLRLIREHDHLAEVPVIVYSTSDQKLKMVETAAFNGFLTKQPKISELVTRLHDIFLKTKV